MSAAKHTLRYEVCRDGTILSFTRWRGNDTRAFRHAQKEACNG